MSVTITVCFPRSVVNVATYLIVKNVYSGAKCEEPQEIHYTTMSGVLSVKPYNETAREKAQNPASFIVFTGSDLTQAKLKDWLRDCAPKVCQPFCCTLK